MLNRGISHQIFDQLPGFIGWKDKDLRHLGCNHNLALVLKLKNTSQIIGLKDQDLPDHNDESELFHKKNDLLALQGKIIKGLHKSSAPYDGSFFFFIKKPLLDNNNRICGLIYYCHEFIASTVLSNMLKMNNKHCAADYIPSHYHIGLYDNVFNLSSRELECLFLILRGKSARQAGEIMSLSKRTIESYIENIKNKFGCSTKVDLLVLAMSHGYMNNIPSRFIQT
jgi:DNA-binding CsgD family transcriptional regulator